MGVGLTMPSSEAKKETTRAMAHEAQVTRTSILEKDAVKRRTRAAAVSIQAYVRRRLACKHRAELHAIARAPIVIRAERFDVWQTQHRACFQPGYSASMLSTHRCQRERHRYPWVRKRRGTSPHAPADFFFSSLRQPSAKAREGDDSVTSEATSDASDLPTSAPALRPSSELLMT